jgi:hypothetical protein
MRCYLLSGLNGSLPLNMRGGLEKTSTLSTLVRFGTLHHDLLDVISSQ